jgi:NADH-quinone oxidoreductase subunit M
MSIVVTAVYILRAIAKTAMGPLKIGFEGITDAKWNEKAAAILLLIGIFAIGIAPSWLVELVTPATQIIKEKLTGK